MKVIIVQVGDIYKFPPIISLINALCEMNIKTVVVSSLPSGDYSSDFPEATFDPIQINYENIKAPYKKMMMIPKIKKQLWNNISKYYDNGSVLWVSTDVTLKFLGERLLGKKYILHLMELSQDLVFYKKIPFIKLNASKYGNQASAIIVPEYNRAHILSAWWNLKKKPLVLPNKPYNPVKVEKDNYIEDETARDILDEIGDKKIILYQGIINEERPLENIIKAVDHLGGKYAFVVMSSGEDIYKTIGSKNYYYIPYVRAPKHLQITSHAYIGVLSYIPTYNTGYSPLNSLYCAPNKTFEFSMFGIPMIGNDIPGLRYLFETEKIGTCFDSFEPEMIAKAIEKIENNYETYKTNALNYYSSCNYKALLTDILEKINIESHLENG